jgi:hypothetical protein
LRREAAAADYTPLENRNTSEYSKKLRALQPEVNIFIPNGQPEPHEEGNNLSEVWRARYSERFNRKWGRAVKEKVVKEVDTFGGKYEEPLNQNRQRLLQRLGIRKFLI